MSTLKVIFNPRRIQTACYWLVFLIFFGFSSSVAAHFEHPFARVIHVVEEGHGLRVYSRLPLALLLLPESWQGVDAGQHLDHVNTIKEGSDWRYYLDKAAIDENPTVLGREIVGSLQLGRKPDGVKETTGIFERLIIHTYDDRPAFNTLEKAKRVFNSGNVPASAVVITPFGYAKQAVENKKKDLEIFDAVVDVQYFVEGGDLRSLHSLESQLGSHLLILDQVLNIVVLHFAEGTVTLTSQGPLNTRVEKEKKTGELRKIGQQVLGGMTHILLGLDHVLFIILLIVAAKNWIDTAKKATVFTLAHSATLGLGLLGYTPSVLWFIPFVETAIAGSIVYAGVLVVTGGGKKYTLSVIAVIGLLHGFGFSFAVNELLLEQGSLHLPNLLAFSLGIELGQLLILLLVSPLLYQASKTWDNKALVLRQTVSMPCILLALFWVFERGKDTYDALTKPVHFESSGPATVDGRPSLSADATYRATAATIN